MGGYWWRRGPPGGRNGAEVGSAEPLTDAWCAILPGMDTPTLTDHQDRTRQVVNASYGDSTVDLLHCPPGSGMVRICGVDEDGDMRCRWLVNPDGRVDMAWDPDFLLDKLVRR